MLDKLSIVREFWFLISFAKWIIRFISFKKLLKFVDTQSVILDFSSNYLSNLPFDYLNIKYLNLKLLNLSSNRIRQLNKLEFWLIERWF